MAEIRKVYLVDDVDPEVTEDVQTLSFGLDGKTYEIDLGDANREKLLDSLAPFVAAARKVSGAPAGRKAGRGTGTAPAGLQTENQAARAWLKANGYKVTDRGRIAADLLDIYRRRDTLDGGVKEEPAPKAKELANDELATDYVASAPEVTDELVMAWWKSKGYKPQTTVSSIMRTQYRAAHNLATPHAS
jgi:hypothetical protein